MINYNSIKKEIQKINSLGDYISTSEKEKIIKALKMKQQIEEAGFYIKHYKIKTVSKKNNYKFSAQKGNYTYATTGNNYYLPIFEIFAWVKKNGEL